MNVIKYKAGGKIHEKTTTFSFVDLEEDVVARKVYIEILEDSSQKLKAGEILLYPTPEEKKVMAPEEVEDWCKLSDIIFVDYYTKKSLTKNQPYV